MYTGGKAYFEQTLTQFGQQASYFAFQNDHWLLVGLDSAYNDPDWKYDKARLTNDQVSWLTNLVNSKGTRKLILFTHHQPVSWFDLQKGEMNNQLGWLLNEKKIFAWYWGHEHRCILYDKHPTWGFYGRCAGHSGYPYFRDKLGAATVELQKADMKWR
ncbi:MAG: metallophosphoesterase family protein [Pyrinomonadaceae bacterium]